MAIQREKSLDVNRQAMHPPNRDMFQGGWMIKAKGSLARCPYCHVQYHQWKPTDDPSNIHRLLSPYCLFVLSPEPLNPSSIPVQTGEERFPSDVISTASRLPYNGLAAPKSSRFSEYTHRLHSFDSYPGGPPSTTSELIQDGFYYLRSLQRIHCFYCGRSEEIPSSGQEVQRPRHSVYCFYDRQNKDRDPTRLPGPSNLL